MPINIFEVEGRVAAVAGGAFFGEAVYEGGVSFLQSMASVDPMLYRPHVNVGCVYGLLFLIAVGAILHANSHSKIEDQTGQDYPNENV